MTLVRAVIVMKVICWLAFARLVLVMLATHARIDCTDFVPDPCITCTGRFANWRFRDALPLCDCTAENDGTVRITHRASA